MKVAARSVVSTLVLMFLFIYIFAIVFQTQLRIPEDQVLLQTRFAHLQTTMWNLLLRGAFLDGPRLMGDKLWDIQSPLLPVWIVFILLSAITILNMLVALLCEVVHAVSMAEREKTVVNFVRERLINVLE